MGARYFLSSQIGTFHSISEYWGRIIKREGGGRAYESELKLKPKPLETYSGKNIACCTKNPSSMGARYFLSIMNQ